MEHVVFFPAHDGSPAFRRVGNLEDAVRLVEHLRNVENVSEVSVHALDEVPLAFKTWYRVEVPAGGPEAPAAKHAVEAPVLVAAQTEGTPSFEAPSVEALSDEILNQPIAALAAAAANGHPAESSGPSSLGFFSR